ncbi:anti-sigma factor [Yinghuangia sp. YIM S10712]|uniref:anti-sigma factor n=1 Tax=Yinghuangia sp. YIM S10712 TaxID=3436930 RepID=UPI003F53871D
MSNIHLNTGAYALHALPPDEHAAFESHLARCDTCTEEAAELTETAARLGLALHAVPPPELRDRVMRAIRTTRQEPALPTAMRRGKRPMRRLPSLALAACAALSAVLGGVAWWQYDRAEDARTRTQASRQQAELAKVLTAPDARAVTGPMAGGATATVVVSAQRDRAVLLATGMAPPAPGTVHQLWFARDGRMVPAGFLPDTGTSAAVLLDGPLDHADAVGVTVEPAGGSAQPTTPPLGLLTIAAGPPPQPA